MLDPFLGSGTTAVACAETGRRCIGFEINPKFAQVARDRVEGIKPIDRKRGYRWANILDFAKEGKC